MKNVLFISFYWVPSGKATLHWPLYIMKHLPVSGWQPSVLTVEEDTFSSKDISLEKEVLPGMKVYKTDFLDPFIFYRKFLGKSPDAPLVASETISKENKSLKHRLSIWIRMNLFVPDARAGWYPYGVKEGAKILQKEKYDAIVTIGPPHSAHLIGRNLARKFNIPFVPVLIDPWMDIVYYKGFRRNPVTLALDRHFEESVMRDASRVVFVTRDTQNDFIRKYPWLRDNSDVLYWGYNEESFAGIKADEFPEIEKDEEVLLHAGNIFDYQSPSRLWISIKKKVDAGRNIRLKFIGSVSPGIKKAIKDAGLGDRTDYLGFLPYDKAVEEICRATYLLVCATEKRHVPGKLFEYMRSGRPILAFGDDNREVEGFLKETNSGMLFKYEDDPEEFFDKAGLFRTDLEKVKQYDRRRLAGKLAEILNSTCK